MPFTFRHDRIASEGVDPYDTGQHRLPGQAVQLHIGSEEHKDWTLSLYNAVNHTHYTNLDAISIETIRQVLYMGMHNDVAFLVLDILSLYEQQSTFNPNMPLRLLEYLVILYEKYIRQMGGNKYGRTLIPLPTPNWTRTRRR